MPESHIKQICNSVWREISSEMLVNAASSIKLNRDASYISLSKIAAQSQPKKKKASIRVITSTSINGFDSRNAASHIKALRFSKKREYSSVLSLLHVGSPGHNFSFVSETSFP